MKETKKLSNIKDILDNLYCSYNKREYVHPDPLEFLYNYKEIRDREIAGFLASSLAYGRVAQILKSVSSVLDKMGSSPYMFLMNSKPSVIKNTFKGFKHRFADEKNLYAVLTGLRCILTEYGSLYECFLKGLDGKDETVLGCMKFFTKTIASVCNGSPGHLVPVVEKGSACKRLHLFLRWMVRKDDVDPGGWDKIPSCMLIVPLDVHMHKIGRLLGFTNRKQADIVTALEITSGFRNLIPDDPVKYDFTLTRFGIRADMDIDNLSRMYKL
ncbi:MAG: TIGR02757 family protein [Desulfobacterium sp.]|nr:TIGR02757 family protein [Desulfobacterium sp.]MBU3949904.1 TIGR02757 family protein [Pseudomonadota bacterium]MBU4011682.1 TIGR02757 family protein [Pseudomonadota bacterium]MBU4036840.1 TIGR02757 family protein [Pseudomonadota bacterium]